jgi:hypothetical protein
MGGADLKDQLLHSYLIEIERMNKWYMKLFRRILNVMIMHRNNTGKRTDFIFQHSIVEGLFVKYANVTECKIPGLHSSDNTVPSLTERHVIVNFDHLIIKQDQRQWVICQKGRGRTWCTGVMHVTLDSAWNVFKTTTPSSISKAIKYHFFVILKVYCFKFNFKI